MGEKDRTLLPYGTDYTEESASRIKAKFLEQIENAGQKKRKLRKRTLLIAAIICCILFAGAVYAAGGFSELYHLLFGKDADYMAEQDAEVNLVSENEGIRLEVESAIRDEDILYLFVTLTDLTNDRLDESVSLDWNLYMARGGTQGVLAYDKQEKKASVFIGTQGIEGIQTAKLSISQLQIKEKIINGYSLENIDVYEILNEHQAQTAKEEVWSESGGILGKETILTPDELSLPIPGYDKLRITNVGFVDGKLHVQCTPVMEEGKKNKILALYFVDGAGNFSFRYSDRIYIGERWYTDPETHVSVEGERVEYIFEEITNREQLAGSTLCANAAWGEVVNGKWDVDFTMPGQTDRLTIAAERATLGGFSAGIKKMVLSPLGLTAQFVLPDKTKDFPDGWDEVAVLYEDGSKLPLMNYEGSCGTKTGEGTIFYSNLSGRSSESFSYIELEESTQPYSFSGAGPEEKGSPTVVRLEGVKAVEINGEIFKVK